jgi:hypothetical protein
LLQGLGTNLLQQGVFMPSNIARAFRLGRELGWEDQHKIFSLMGEGAAKALDADSTGWLSQSIHHASGFWNVVVDRLPRVTSFLHEARRMGYDTPEKLKALLNDEKHRNDLHEITDRANKEAIDYSMTPIEKASLRRLFFFYPWLRGATLWSLRFPLEHPLQAAIYAPIAERAHAKNEVALGKLPSYCRDGDEGRRVGGQSEGDQPGNLNNFQTLADVVKGVAGLTRASGRRTRRSCRRARPRRVVRSTRCMSGKDSLGHDLPAASRTSAARSDGSFGSLPPAVIKQRVDRKPNAAEEPGEAAALRRAADDAGRARAGARATLRRRRPRAAHPEPGRRAREGGDGAW